MTGGVGILYGEAGVSAVPDECKPRKRCRGWLPRGSPARLFGAVPLLQTLVQVGARVIPRGWSHIAMSLGRLHPRFQRYSIVTTRGDRLILDLRQRMCTPYLLYGEIPHDQGVDRIIRAVVREGNVCVDVGANIGYYTRLLSDLVGTTGRVTAFEPLPEALRLLHQNVSGRPNVRVMEAAVSDSASTSRFFVARAEDMSSLSPTAGARNLDVRTITLDSALADVTRLDFVKIDVEGFEYQVLSGALSVLRKHEPIVVFELTQRYINAYGRDIGDFAQLLRPLDYEVHWLSQARDGHILTPFRSNDAVAIPRSKVQLLS